jgi:hypothetical protein
MKHGDASFEAPVKRAAATLRAPSNPPMPIMIKLLAIALFFVLAGTLAVHAMPRDAGAHEAVAEWPVQASFDIAMPALSEPLDSRTAESASR